MKYFLGLAHNFSAADALRHLFTIGTPRDSARLKSALAAHYSGQASAELFSENHLANPVKKQQSAEPGSETPPTVLLTKNGRSALALAIRALVPKGSKVIVNGFTCQAVVEAIRAASCTPIYADIEESTLHYDLQSLKKALKSHPSARAIIVQNTLGLPADPAIYPYARKKGLRIIEDLAHSARLRPGDAPEAGFLGDALALSFGKGKSLDCISGGALVLRSPAPLRPLENQLPPASRRPRLADSLRARLYPSLATVARALTPSVFAKLWLGGLLKLRLIERSADSRLDPSVRLTHWQAKLILKKFGATEAPQNTPLRRFYLVRNRDALLKELELSGFYFREIWYDSPISPARNYQKWHFPEAECPVATRVAKEIVNLPTDYPAKRLEPALKIIRKYQK